MRSEMYASISHIVFYRTHAIKKQSLPSPVKNSSMVGNMFQMPTNQMSLIRLRGMRVRKSERAMANIMFQ